jgi:hypothetical protein
MYWIDDETFVMKHKYAIVDFREWDSVNAW